MSEQKILKELRISLSSFNGKVDYLLTSKSFKILKSTGKTIVIQKTHGEYRVLKTELDEIKNMCKNDKAQELSFSKYTYADREKDNIELLFKIIKDQVSKLHKDSINAYKFSRDKNNLKIIIK